MQNLRVLSLGLVLLGLLQVSFSGETGEIDADDAKTFLDETVGQSMKGFGNFFKGIADGVKDKSEDSIDVLKSFSESAKEKSGDAAEGAKKFLDETVGGSMKGFSNFFKGISDGVKDRSEDGMDALKSFSAGAKDKSEDVADSMKGFAEGLGDRFNKAKEKLQESGDKMKEAVGDAALNTRKELESAASEISKHAKGAGETVMKLFGKK